MKTCDHLDRYCAGDLDPLQRAAFEAHLEQCARCADSATKWHEVKTEIAAMAQDAGQAMPVATGSDTRRLIERARIAGGAARRPLVWLRPGLVAAAVVALVAVGLVLAWQLKSGPPKGDPLRIDARLFEPGRSRPVRIAAQRAGQITVPTDSRVLMSIGDQKIGMGPLSSLTIVKARAEMTHLDLAVGTVICSVPPRRDGSEFVVEAGQLRVRVTGTIFAVERTTDEHVEISVIRGTVEVVGPGHGAKTIPRGQRYRRSPQGAVQVSAVPGDKSAQLQLLLSEVSEEPAAELPAAPRGRPLAGGPDAGATPEETTGKTAPHAPRSKPGRQVDTLEQWRDWIIEGRLGDAQGALEAHVRQRPKDAQAWALLADCRRKKGDFPAAVSAYRKVIALAEPNKANRARFRAGALLQDKLGDHEAAITLLEDYIRLGASNRTLHAEAMFRIAQSRLALGQDKEATDLLDEIVQKHRGTSAAARARQILNGRDEN